MLNMLTILALGTTFFATPGNWQIRKDVDAMTDKVSCVAFHKNDPKGNVQMNNEMIIISLRGRGGVKGVTLRFDDKPAHSP